MRKKKMCTRCGHESEISCNTKRVIEKKIISNCDDIEQEKIYCPYYPHSEITHDAYYYNFLFQNLYILCYRTNI